MRLGTPALLFKNKLSSVKIISLETKLLSSNLLSTLLIALIKFWPKLHYLVHSDEDHVFPGAFLKYYYWPVRVISFCGIGGLLIFCLKLLCLKIRNVLLCSLFKTYSLTGCYQAFLFYSMGQVFNRSNGLMIKYLILYLMN